MRLVYATLALLLFAFTSCTKINMIDSSYELEEAVIEEEIIVATSIEEDGLFELINAYRESIGLNSFSFNTVTYVEASEHNTYMIASGKLSHENFNDRANKIAKRNAVKNISENVANNYVTNEDTLEAWLKSPRHKKILKVILHKQH